MMQRYLVLLSSMIAAAASSSYPQNWIRNGECLDDNKGPLQIGVKPQNNPNIVAVVDTVFTFDDCVAQCLNSSQCSYFTFYATAMPQQAQKSAPTNGSSSNSSSSSAVAGGCQLVGFNLKAPCYTLMNTCVLLAECAEFDQNCTTCQTGMRPLMDPMNEPMTLVMNGDTDITQLDDTMYSEDAANFTELIFNNGSTCKINDELLVPRLGAVAAYIAGTVINCGGYSSTINNGSYLSLCQTLFLGVPDMYDEYGDNGLSANWTTTTAANLTTPRAFAASVVVGNASNGVLYVAGGYNAANGFLNSVEMYSVASGMWSIVAGMQLPEKKSHFCLVMAGPDVLGVSYLYAIGGWNLGGYLASVHRIQINLATGANVGGWQAYKNPLNQTRGDLACAEVQVDATKTGIMAAGGYSTDGAWLSSVEFLDFSTGQWYPLVLFPSLQQGRHNHGLTTIGLMPMVFGGWNNGSLSSMECLNTSSVVSQNQQMMQPVTWNLQQQTLLARRERFSYARVPAAFMQYCV